MIAGQSLIFSIIYSKKENWQRADKDLNSPQRLVGRCLGWEDVSGGQLLWHINVQNLVEYSSY